MSILYEKFQKKAIIRALELEKYMSIRNIINNKNINISEDLEFQKTFNAFFRVRRNEEWRRKFYNYFEFVKCNSDVKFEEILIVLSNENIEASFSSKLLATINPDMPIWDKFVLNYFNINVVGETKKERIEDTIKKYYELIEKVNCELEKKEIKEAINQFKEEFMEYDLSDAKILDFIIWSNRDRDDRNEKRKENNNMVA